MTTDKQMTKVALRGPHGDVETLWAEVVGDNRYCLANTPWYAYNISWRDIVEALPDADGQLQFTRVLEKGGHRTVRIRSQDPFTSEWLEKIPALGACRASDQPGQNALANKGDFHSSGGLVWSLLIDGFPMRTGRSNSPRALVSNLFWLATMPDRRRHVTQGRV